MFLFLPACSPAMFNATEAVLFWLYFFAIFIFFVTWNGVCEKKKTRRKPEIRKIEAAKKLEIVKRIDFR